MTGTIDDILNDREPEAETEQVEAAETPEAPEQPEVAEEATEGRVRDEKGRFAPKGDKEEVAPPAPVEESHIPVRALQDERSKRQALEQRLQQLEAQLQANQPQAPAPDLYEDETAWFNHRLTGVLPQITENVRNELRMERVKESAEEARGKYDDYDQTIDTFRALAEMQPALMEQMIGSKNPAEFAYKTAKTHTEVQQYGSIDALIEKRLKDREAELLQSTQAQLPSAPPSISSDRSVGARSGPAWGGPAPMSELLK